MYYFYILQSELDLSYYVGQCHNIEDRLERHNQGRNKYTKLKCPWQLVYFEEYETRSEAMSREQGIKKKKSKRYIEWLIKKNVNKKSS